jgi:hypothetical protein
MESSRIAGSVQRSKAHPQAARAPGFKPSWKAPSNRAHKPSPPALPTSAYVAIAAGIVGLSAILLAAMGRPFACPCGEVLPWYGAAGGRGNSQHLADWYSLLHLTHGALNWLVFYLTSRHWPYGWLVVMGVLMAAGWEIAENTPWVIDSFGPAPSGATYQGDSILNSLSDLLFATAGYVAAMHLDWKRIAALVIAIELLVGVAVRDGILLGSLGMVAPVPAITEWQRGADPA